MSTESTKTEVSKVPESVIKLVKERFNVQRNSLIASLKWGHGVYDTEVKNYSQALMAMKDLKLSTDQKDFDC